MSHITASDAPIIPPHDDYGHQYDLSPANITLPQREANRWGLPLIVAGAVLLLATLAVGAYVFIHRAAGKAAISSTSSTMLKPLMSAGVDGRPWRSTNERLA